uniref:Prominin-like protein n=1 Tax=Strigamia maritima TaxID=126957 RepID=T1IK67_STRMM
SGEIVKSRLAETSKASAIENLTNIVEGLDKVHEDLENITQGTQSLIFQVRQLDESLKDIRNRITMMLASCRDQVCEEIRRYAGSSNLTVTASLYQLPDVSDIAHKISDFIQKGVEAEVRKGKDSLDKISVLVQQAVDRTVPEIKLKLIQVGKELEDHSDNLCGIIDKVELQRGRTAVNTIKAYSDEYASLRHYVGLGLCCAVLLITICFVCGLFCGFCGHKPHPYGNDTCSRVTGANFLMAAVYLIFLLSIFLLAVITLLFLVGGVAERVVCDPIQDSQNGSVFELAETFLIDKRYLDERLNYLPISDVMRNCHQNLSIYNVLHLEHVFNITEAKNYKERYKLDDQGAELRQQIALNPPVLILTAQATQQLRELAESEFAKLDFDSFMKRLDLPVTPIDLNDVMHKLDEVSGYVRNDIAYNLKRERDTLDYLQREVVANVTATMTKIKKYLLSVQTNILFNKTTFREIIYDLLNQAEQAQKFIQTHGRTEVMNLADEFTVNFTRLLDEYAKHIEHKVQIEIGQCGPMSKAFNSSVVGVCKNIISPFNGFWASIGWCILLFMPSIIFAVLLSSSYRKTDPYTGPLVESAHKKRRPRTSETYDNRNGYVPDYMLGAGEDAARFRREAYPQPSSHANSRYSRVDVTPTYAPEVYKPSAPSANWTPDYSSSSNLGSPDYERPPPYYFPGPMPENNG